jgi:Family of unknown function (DUF5681)
MPEFITDPLLPSCYHLFLNGGIQRSQQLAPDRLPSARDARGRFAKGSSGNPQGRPRGIPNPRRRVPDLVARPLSAPALSDLLDRKPHLLPLPAARLLPPPLASIDPAERLGNDPSSLARPRIAGRCWPLFWRPLRAARSRPPRARTLQSG